MCYHAHKGPVRFILPVVPLRRDVSGERAPDPPLNLLPPPPGHPRLRLSAAAANPDTSTSYEGIAASGDSLSQNSREKMVSRFTFWAAGPLGTLSCRAWANFLLVYTSVRSSPISARRAD